MAKTEVRVYALMVVAAVALAAIVITGLNTFGYSTAQGTTTMTVTGTVAISAATATVAFGSMIPNGVNNTLGGNPPPFVLQNDGNVLLNVTINATDLFTSAANPTGNYTFNANTTTEGICFFNATGESTITATNMYATGAATKFLGRLNFTDTCDTAEVEIRIIVPSGEPTGAKSSTVGFTATQS